MNDAHLRAELETKCATFLDEMALWKDEARNLPAHRSQLERITGLLVPVGKGIQDRVGAASSGAGQAYRLTSEVLLLFRVWSFYREKLSQRFVPWQRELLDVADELAYRWWRPAYDAALATKRLRKEKAGIAKEPPLVYLNGDVSPLTLTRGTAFDAEAAEGLDPARVIWARKLLAAVPVPTIGMPYFAARHAPDLVILGHEVGHNVEDDFQLKGELTGAVTTALVSYDGSIRDAWSRWMGETFADLWGVLVGGPAFVDAMIQFALPAAGQADTQVDRLALADYGAHPPLVLRAECLFEALTALGMNDEAEPRRHSFRTLFPAPDSGDFEGSCGPVVGALLACEPKAFKKSVRAASGFKPSQMKLASDLARTLADGFKVPGNPDTATLIRAIALAFMKKPDQVAARERSDLLWKALRATVTKGVRSAHATPAPTDVDAADRRIAAELLSDLT